LAGGWTPGNKEKCGNGEWQKATSGLKIERKEQLILFIFWPTVLVAWGVLEKQIGRAAVPNIIKGCGTGRKKEKEEKRRKKHHPSEEED
jgi:hypothetical protein